MKIFISYSSKDRDTAEFIHAELTKRGLDSFLDYEQLQEGDDFFARLARELKSRDKVLFLMSSHSVASHWVESELKYAFQNRKPIVPLVLESCELPDSLFFITLVQHRRFERSSKSFDQLFKALTGKDALPNSETPANAPKEDETTSEVVDPIEWLRGQTASEVGDVEVEVPIAAIDQLGSAKKFLENANKTLRQVLSEPFEWCLIPKGGIEILGTKYLVSTFAIAKYPITRAQFAVFYESEDGSSDAKWWDYSRYAKDWHMHNASSATISSKNDRPMSNVDWYEAVAFCRWLQWKTAQMITLPTEPQWQRAAQGSDERVFPWGNSWDSARCNSSRGPSGKPTSVTEHPEGMSPFGVMDMSGNVYEWCLTSYSGKSNDISLGVERVIKGGSYEFSNPDRFRCDHRERGSPRAAFNGWGFRIALILPPEFSSL